MRLWVPGAAFFFMGAVTHAALSIAQTNGDRVARAGFFAIEIFAYGMGLILLFGSVMRSDDGAEKMPGRTKIGYAGVLLLALIASASILFALP